MSLFQLVLLHPSFCDPVHVCGSTYADLCFWRTDTLGRIERTVRSRRATPYVRAWCPLLQRGLVSQVHAALLLLLKDLRQKQRSFYDRQLP